MNYAHIFNVIFYVKRGDLQLMFLVTAYVSSFCVMAWWYPEFRVETSWYL